MALCLWKWQHCFVFEGAGSHSFRASYNFWTRKHISWNQIQSNSRWWIEGNLQSTNVIKGTVSSQKELSVIKLYFINSDKKDILLLNNILIATKGWVYSSVRLHLVWYCLHCFAFLSKSSFFLHAFTSSLSFKRKTFWESDIFRIKKLLYFVCN